MSDLASRARAVALVWVLLGAAGSGCLSTSHPDPPPLISGTVRVPFDDAGPIVTSPATVEHLQALGAAQHELFAAYRLEVGDSFHVIVTNQPDWAATVVVLHDGQIHFGPLGRSLPVRGLTIDETIRTLIHGDPPRRSCPNCGCFYPPADGRCPVCEAVPERVGPTARVVLSQSAIATVRNLAGVAPAAIRPLRRVQPVAGAVDHLLICNRGLVGLDFRDGTSATVVWQLPLAEITLPHDLLDSDKPVVELQVLAGKRWARIDLATGSQTLREPGVEMASVTIQPGEQPGGLNRYFSDPRVVITDFVPGRSANTVKVVGAVNTPGRVPIRSGSRVWDAITDAGGPVVRSGNVITTSDRSSSRLDPSVDWQRAVLMREARFLPEALRPPDSADTSLVRLRVDLAALAEGDAQQNVPLFPGDVIYLPEYAPAEIDVVVVGEVNSPNEYHLRAPARLITALARAGWMNESRAVTTSVVLVRRPRGLDGEREVYLVNGLAVAKGLAPDIPLEDGDIIYVDTDFLTDFNEALQKISPLLTGPQSLTLRGVRDVNDLIDEFR